MSTNQENESKPANPNAWIGNVWAHRPYHRPKPTATETVEGKLAWLETAEEHTETEQ